MPAADDVTATDVRGHHDALAGGRPSRDDGGPTRTGGADTGH